MLLKQLTELLKNQISNDKKLNNVKKRQIFKAITHFASKIDLNMMYNFLRNHILEVITNKNSKWNEKTKTKNFNSKIRVHSLKKYCKFLNR